MERSHCNRDSELLKLLRMLRLVVRHSTARRLALAALVAWLVRRAVRKALRRISADRLALALCEDASPAGMRRVQSVHARLETIHEAGLVSHGASARKLLPRSYSVGNLVRQGIAPRGLATVSLEELGLFPALHKQKLCTECLSRCSSTLSLASLEVAAITSADGTEVAEDLHALSKLREGRLVDSPVGGMRPVAADCTVQRNASATALSATGSTGKGSTGNLSSGTGGPAGSSGCLEAAGRSDCILEEEEDPDLHWASGEYSILGEAPAQQLARVAARLEAETSGEYLDARHLGSCWQSCEGCVACSAAESTWRTVTTRALTAGAAATLAYCVWLRCFARREVALDHVMGLLRRLGQLFRYRVEGLEHIPKQGPAMVYCYHGFIPLDMYFFQEAVYRLTGRLPRVLVADFVFKVPFFSWIVALGGGVPAGRRAALEQLRRGELVIVAPGGVREGMSTTGQDYAVNWYGRQGFAETALAAGAPLIPMCTRNVRELFLVLGGNLPLVLKLYRLTRLPFTPFFGPLLVPLTTLLGAPIEHDPQSSPAQVISLAKRAMEALLQRATAGSS